MGQASGLFVSAEVMKAAADSTFSFLHKETFLENESFIHFLSTEERLLSQSICIFVTEAIYIFIA